MSYINESTRQNEISADEQNNNKINIVDEENYLIGRLLRETIVHENEFISPPSKIKWEWENQNSYHFKQDIERVWLILLELIQEKKI